MTTAAFLLGAILGIIAGLALAERVWKYALVTRFFKNFEVRADSSSPLLARNERRKVRGSNGGEVRGRSAERLQSLLASALHPSHPSRRNLRLPLPKRSERW